MTGPERIHAYLAAREQQPLCDDCIQKGLGLAKRQQVQPITSAFGLTSDFDRRDGVCVSCGDEKLVTKLVRHAGR